MTEREGEKTKSEAKTRKGGFEKGKKVGKKRKGEKISKIVSAHLSQRVPLLLNRFRSSLPLSLSSSLSLLKSEIS